MTEKHRSGEGEEAAKALPAAAILGDCAGDRGVEIWNETPRVRLIRALARLGITRVLNEAEVTDHSGALLLFRDDTVFDAPILKGLLDDPGLVLTGSAPGASQPLAAHAPPGALVDAMALLRDQAAKPSTAALKIISPAELGASYWHALRKREVPYALQVTQGTRRAIEWRMFMGTYKGATDVVTKWVWPRPAFYITKVCARFAISPNMVTYLSLVLTIGAFIWFLKGAWAAGLIAGWLMTFLDTVDGKLARVTLTSSKFGNALDHGIDLIHPPFWWVAWGVGVQNSSLALPDEVLFASLAVILAGYLLQRAMEGLSIWFFKIEIHVWRPVDTLFRQITARRNPNMVLLTLGALAGRPDLGLVAVALWTGLCLLLHGLQLLQAWSRWRRDGKLTSWMTEAAG